MTEKIKIMFNEDPNHHIGELAEARAYRGADFKITEQMEKEFVYQYQGTQLTDYLINVNFMCSVYPSRTRDSYAYKRGIRMENGKQVDYGENNEYYNIFIRDGLDLFAIWIRYFREIGVRPWLSFRMNDCHDSASETSFMQSNFFYDHPEYRRVRHHIADGYFARCFDYSIQAVRDDMLAYINESLERYDVDGIELDFMREMFCFAPGQEYAGIEIMNEYMRTIRNAVAHWEQVRGHKIFVGVKLFAIPHQVYYSGFDVFTWAKEHLIDVLVVGPRWETVDNDLPVEVWKKMMEPYGVQVGAALDLILRCHPHGEFYYLNTHETALGSCAQNLSAGADFTYLFNYMRPNAVDYTKQLNYPIYQEENYQMLLRNGGQLETAVNSPRRHIVTFHDIEPQWECWKLSHLPCTCEFPVTYTQVRVRCGFVPENTNVYLILGAQLCQSEEEIAFDSFDCYLNSVRVHCCGTCDISPYSKMKGYCFRIEDPAIVDLAKVVEIGSTGAQKFEVEYVELRVGAEL